MHYTGVHANNDGTFSASCYGCGPFGTPRKTREDADRDGFDHVKKNDPDAVDYATYDEYRADNPA